MHNMVHALNKVAEGVPIEAIIEGKGTSQQQQCTGHLVVNLLPQIAMWMNVS